MRPNSLFTRFSAAAKVLSVERPVSSAWEIGATRLGLSPTLTLLLSCQSPPLVAHLTQTDAQRL